MEWTALLWIALSFVLAGSVKGLTGLGFPTAAVALLVLVVDPRSAVALLCVSIFVVNIWQCYRAGAFLQAAKHYWLIALTLVCTILLMAWGTRDLSDRGVMVFVACTILIYVGVSWFGRLPPIPDRRDRLAQISFGVIGGLMGGLTGTWGPAIAMYLTSRGVEKDDFIRATGFIILIAALPLFWSYWQIGFLTGDLLGLSAVMLVPTLIGFTIGEAVRARVSVARFRQIILLMFLALALNLLRRAMF